VEATPFWRTHTPAIIIGLIDVFAIGLGMGVPIFAILLGFPVGWWLGRRLGGAPLSAAHARGLLLAAAALSGASFVVLVVLWGPQLPLAFDPATDAASYGIPLILYTSRASLIGWFALMLVISPALQFTATITGAVAGLAFPARAADGAAKGEA
jgi:hypothetical protein